MASDKLVKKLSKLVKEFGFEQVRAALVQFEEIRENSAFNKIMGISKTGKYKEVTEELGRTQLVPDDSEP